MSLPPIRCCRYCKTIRVAPASVPIYPCRACGRAPVGSLWRALVRSALMRARLWIRLVREP